MEEKTVLQPVGCAPKQSFVLKPLVGLLPQSNPVKAPPLWRNYWSEGELCVLAGDTGAGKTLLSVTIAKEIAKGCETIAPRKVLYIGHDYDTRGFAERYGKSDAEADGNFFFALFNQGNMVFTRSITR
ncbi:MAG: AAA family ATPase [Sphingobacteriales bacterium JAD_PAG50586_3]|nr:MAG: AAA family ATPase [Sphingobacteriales bacterium JAD_PAG50586_3]